MRISDWSSDVCSSDLAAEQQGGVDGREFGAAVAVAGFHIEEMVEEALVAAGAAGLRPLRRVPEEAQGGERAIARLRPRHPALLDAVGIDRKSTRMNSRH